jgi:hypothetical protein
MTLGIETKPEEARGRNVRHHRDVGDGIGAAEELRVPEQPLELVVEASRVSPGGLVHLWVTFPTPELHERHRIHGRVELRVGEVLHEPALRAQASVGRIERGLRMTVLEVLADQGGIIEREVVVDERGNLGSGVHVDEVRAVAVPVECAHPLERHALLVEGNPNLAGVWAKDVVEKRQHVPRLPTPGTTATARG